MLRILALLSVLLTGTLAASSSTRLSPFGIIEEGITDCGSGGTLGIVQVTDCTRTPCHFIPNTVYDISIRFTASRTSATLSLQVLKADDFTMIIDFPILGEIEAGIEYELTFQLPVTTDFAGAAFDVRFYILDLESFRVEICAEAAVEIGKAVKLQ